RGVARQALNQLDAAVADFSKAVALAPDYAEAYYNRANALRDQRKFEAALADFDKVVAIKPDYAEAYNNRGVALRELKKFDAAIADYDRAIAIKPDAAAAYNNRGIAREQQRQLDAAIADYDKAIAIDPDFAEAYWNKALALLLRGDYATGFQLYEWRLKIPNLKIEPRRFAEPLWLGEEPLHGKTILLHSEQGLGDTIQFCRYVPLVARAGGKIILEVPQALVGL